MGFLRLCGKAWGSLDAISIDDATLEKTKDLSMVPLLSDWSDLGDWNSVWKKSHKGPDQLSLSANSHAFDCHGSLIHSEGDNQKVVGLGLENIIVVAMQDAVLVANKNRTQELKGVVDHLAKLKLAQTTAFTKDYCPWEWFESFLISDQYQVKRIVLGIGAATSLQSHEHRSEHWIFVGGQAEVTIDGTKRVFSAGESVFVPTGSVHRLSNPINLPAMSIEVQISTYLGEDDIKRYEDLYGRRVEE